MAIEDQYSNGAAAQSGMAVFPDDDYTGRMGPDGEPERYSTMRGGDPRVRQQRELAVRQQRLQEPFSIDNWLKSANKDVRGTNAASQITLNPGTQYQIRDYSGKNDGQIIASGSTPEEFLMLQDVARGLARQGTNADYRIEQVGGTAQGGFGQYRDPATGEVITTLGGDLYNKPIAGDILKIALPAALALIPGVGTGLSAGLAAKGSVAAKMIGAGLASGIGRTAAGVLTGDPVLDSLKAGAISGLGSAATAGLLDKIGIDKALSNAFSGTKGALAGEVATQGVGQGISEAAKKVAEEGLITVVGQRLAPSLVSSGLSAAGGSLLGNIGKPVDPFQQAMDQARLDNEFGLGETVVSGSRIPTGGSPLAGAPDAIRNIVGAQEVLGNAPATAEEEALVTGRRIEDVNLGGGLAAAAGAVPTLATPETLDPGGITVTGSRIPDTKLDSSLAAATGAAAAGALAQESVQTASERAADQPQEEAEKDPKKGNTLQKVLGGLTLLDILSGALGGGKGAGTATGGAGKLNPIFSAKLPGASPAFSQQTLAPRPGGVSGAPMSDVDWYRYGYNPERSFFNYVPATQAEREAMMVKPPSPLEVKARGGTIAAKKGGAPAKESFAVKGPGTGRSDEIPALLSDGEYVIDAETVALLGDGSSEAGAKRLDDFRVNVRKHKGSNLARGKFSANAKRPEKYLAGGRV
jgi:hypothetical protein